MDGYYEPVFDNLFNPDIRIWGTEILKLLNSSNPPDVSEIHKLIQEMEMWNSFRGQECMDLLDRRIDILTRLINGETGDELYRQYYNMPGSSLPKDISIDVLREMLSYTQAEKRAFEIIMAENNRILGVLKEYESNMINTRQQIYKIERYVGLYQYDAITVKEDFAEYLNRVYDTNGDFKYLSQAELAIFYYLKEKYNDKGASAKEYYAKLGDLINQRKGLEQANKYINEIIKTNGGLLDILHDMGITANEGLNDGVKSFLSGLVDIFAHDGIQSDLEYKQSYINYILTREYLLDIDSVIYSFENGSTNDKLEAEKILRQHGLLDEYGKIALSKEEVEQYKKIAELSAEYRAALGITYQVAVGIGNMAIPMTVGAVITAATGGTGAPAVFLGMTAGELATLGLMGLSATGRGFEEAHQAGITGWKMYLYGVASGLSEVAIEQLLGGIPGLSNADELSKSFLKAFAKSVFEEGAEEFIQTYISYGLKGIFQLPVDWNNIHGDALNSMIMGMLTAAIINGGSVIVQDVAGQLMNFTITADMLNADGTINIVAIENMLRLDEKWKENRIGVRADELFDNFSGEGKYGQNQGWFNSFWRDGVNGINEYEYLKQKIMRQYNMSAETAMKILGGIDSIGACTYAVRTDVMLAQFQDKPEVFQQMLGYPFYNTDPTTGEKYVNGNELMLDLYMHFNHADNGGKLFATVNGETKIISTKEVDGVEVLDASNQIYLSNSFSDREMKDFLKEKSDGALKYSVSKKDYTYLFYQNKLESIKKQILKKLEGKESVSMSIWASPDGEIKMININDNRIWSTNSMIKTDIDGNKEYGGHAIYVTDMNEYGLIVSSWGEPWLILYEDLKNGAFILNYEKIKIKN